MIDLAYPCPICATNSAARFVPACYLRCPACDHRWRVFNEVTAVDYRNQSGRNKHATPWFQRKLSARAEALKDLIDRGKVRRVLEVGCAEGALGERLKAERTILYDGVEISMDVAHAALVLDHAYAQAAASLSVEEPYDLVVCFHVLEHLVDPVAEMSAWRSLLAEAGQLLVEVPNGSGHPLLDDDRNAEHLHQFSPASLVMLCSRSGFAATQMTTGHYESPGYVNCLRVIARQRPLPDQSAERLSQRILARLGPDFAIYGVGGDFRTYIEPIIDRLPVAALLDSSRSRWGECIGGLRVEGDCRRLPSATRFLICSLRFGAEISADLTTVHGIDPSRIVGIEEILDGA